MACNFTFVVYYLLNKNSYIWSSCMWYNKIRISSQGLYLGKDLWGEKVIVSLLMWSIKWEYKKLKVKTTIINSYVISYLEAMPLIRPGGDFMSISFLFPQTFISNRCCWFQSLLAFVSLTFSDHLNIWIKSMLLIL